MYCIATGLFHSPSSWLCWANARLYKPPLGENMGIIWFWVTILDEKYPWALPVQQPYRGTGWTSRKQNDYEVTFWFRQLNDGHFVRIKWKKVLFEWETDHSDFRLLNRHFYFVFLKMETMRRDLPFPISYVWLILLFGTVLWIRCAHLLENANLPNSIIVWPSVCPCKDHHVLMWKTSGSKVTQLLFQCSCSS